MGATWRPAWHTARAEISRARSHDPLNVYEHEPQVAQELLAPSNVVLTPHLGSVVKPLRESMAIVVVNNVIVLIEGQPPVSCFNPQVQKKLFCLLPKISCYVAETLGSLTPAPISRTRHQV